MLYYYVFFHLAVLSIVTCIPSYRPLSQDPQHGDSNDQDTFSIYDISKANNGQNLENPISILNSTKSLSDVDNNNNNQRSDIKSESNKEERITTISDKYNGYLTDCKKTVHSTNDFDGDDNFKVKKPQELNKNKILDEMFSQVFLPPSNNNVQEPFFEDTNSTLLNKSASFVNAAYLHNTSNETLNTKQLNKNLTISCKSGIQNIDTCSPEGTQFLIYDDEQSHTQQNISSHLNFTSLEPGNYDIFKHLLKTFNNTHSFKITDLSNNSDIATQAYIKKFLSPNSGIEKSDKIIEQHVKSDEKVPIEMSITHSNYVASSGANDNDLNNTRNENNENKLTTMTGIQKYKTSRTECQSCDGPSSNMSTVLILSKDILVPLLSDTNIAFSKNNENNFLENSNNVLYIADSDKTNEVSKDYSIKTQAHVQDFMTSRPQTNNEHSLEIPSVIILRDNKTFLSNTRNDSLEYKYIIVNTRISDLNKDTSHAVASTTTLQLLSYPDLIKQGIIQNFITANSDLQRNNERSVESSTFQNPNKKVYNYAGLPNIYNSSLDIDRFLKNSDKTLHNFDSAKNNATKYYYNIATQANIQEYPVATSTPDVQNSDKPLTELSNLLLLNRKEKFFHVVNLHRSSDQYLEQPFVIVNIADSNNASHAANVMAKNNVLNLIMNSSVFQRNESLSDVSIVNSNNKLNDNVTHFGNENFISVLNCSDFLEDSETNSIITDSAEINDVSKDLDITRQAYFQGSNNSITNDQLTLFGVDNSFSGSDSDDFLENSSNLKNTTNSAKIDDASNGLDITTKAYFREPNHNNLHDQIALPGVDNSFPESDSDDFLEDSSNIFNNTASPKTYDTSNGLYITTHAYFQESNNNYSHDQITLSDVDNSFSELDSDDFLENSSNILNNTDSAKIYDVSNGLDITTSAYFRETNNNTHDQIALAGVDNSFLESDSDDILEDSSNILNNTDSAKIYDVSNGLDMTTPAYFRETKNNIHDQIALHGVDNSFSEADSDDFLEDSSNILSNTDSPKTYDASNDTKTQSYFQETNNNIHDQIALPDVDDSILESDSDDFLEDSSNILNNTASPKTYDTSNGLYITTQAYFQESNNNYSHDQITLSGVDNSFSELDSDDFLENSSNILSITDSPNTYDASNDIKTQSYFQESNNNYSHDQITLSGVDNSFSELDSDEFLENSSNILNNTDSAKIDDASNGLDITTQAYFREPNHNNLHDQIALPGVDNSFLESDSDDFLEDSSNILNNTDSAKIYDVSNGLDMKTPAYFRETNNNIHDQIALPGVDNSFSEADSDDFLEDSSNILSNTDSPKTYDASNDIKTQSYFQETNNNIHDQITLPDVDDSISESDSNNFLEDSSNILNNTNSPKTYDASNGLDITTHAYFQESNNHNIHDQISLLGVDNSFLELDSDDFLEDSSYLLNNTDSVNIYDANNNLDITTQAYFPEPIISAQELQNSDVQAKKVLRPTALKDEIYEELNPSHISNKSLYPNNDFIINTINIFNITNLGDTREESNDEKVTTQRHIEEFTGPRHQSVDEHSSEVVKILISDNIVHGQGVAFDTDIFSDSEDDSFLENPIDGVRTDNFDHSTVLTPKHDFQITDTWHPTIIDITVSKQQIADFQKLTPPKTFDDPSKRSNKKYLVNTINKDITKLGHVTEPSITNPARQTVEEYSHEATKILVDAHSNDKREPSSLTENSIQAENKTRSFIIDDIKDVTSEISNRTNHNKISDFMSVSFLTPNFIEVNNTITDNSKHPGFLLSRFGNAFFNGIGNLVQGGVGNLFI